MEKQNLKVTEVAQIMGKNTQFVRLGLQRGEFKWGSAVKISKTRYSYHIAPEAFWEYMGGKPQ